MEHNTTFVGEKLLAEVEDASLNEILAQAAARDVARNLRPIYHLPAVDALFHRCWATTLLANNTPVLEIVSTEPAGGKTHLIYIIVAATVLSDDKSGGGAVVVVDADNTFEVARQAQVIELVREKITKYATATKTTKQALQLIHVFRPWSLTSMINLLKSLPGALPLHASVGGQEPRLALVAVDSMSAFFWQHVHADDVLKNEAAHEAEHESTVNISYTSLVNALRALQDNSGAAVVATSWSLSPPPQKLSRSTSLKPHLPLVWQNFVSLRLVVERKSVNKFPAQLDLQQIERDKQARLDVITQGVKCTAHVDISLLPRLSFVDVDAVQRGMELQFEFTISQAGIEIEPNAVSHA